MMRLFIAAPITPEAEKALADIISRCKNIGGPVKWVAPTNIHLTMKFLGETEKDKVEKLSAIVEDISAKQTAIECQIGRLGGFPNLNRPRVIWAGLEGEITKLELLAAELDDAVHTLGWEKEERRFRAHLTLGRVKQPRGMHDITRFLNDYKMAPIELKFDRLILFKSILTPRGPIYDILHQARFKES